jgi:hypothetical protein
MNKSTVWWTGSTGSAHRVYEPSLNESRRLADQGPRLKPPKCFLASNLGCTSQNGRTLTSSSSVGRQETGVQGNLPWLATRGAQAHYLGHQILIRFFLHDLGNVVKQFCSPLTMAMVHERLATTERFGRWLVTLMAASGETLVLRTTSVATVMTGGPPPSNNST